MTTKEQIIEALDTLNEQQQREILNAIAKVKNRPDPEPGWKAVEHAKQLGFSPEDLDQMRAAIEEAFETVSDAPEVNLDE